MAAFYSAPTFSTHTPGPRLGRFGPSIARSVFGGRGGPPQPVALGEVIRVQQCRLGYTMWR